MIEGNKHTHANNPQIVRGADLNAMRQPSHCHSQLYDLSKIPTETLIAVLEQRKKNENLEKENITYKQALQGNKS